MKYIFLLFSFLLKSLYCNFTGIDVSQYQGTINWEEASKSNYFAIIKAGSKNGIDPYWETNYIGAKNSGLKLGAYWYSYATSEEDAISEAKSLIKVLEGKQLDLPIFYDIEEASIFSKGIEDTIAHLFCKVLYYEDRFFYLAI